MKVCKKLCSVVLALVLTACGGKAVQQEGFRPVNEKATPEAVLTKIAAMKYEPDESFDGYAEALRAQIHETFAQFAQSGGDEA